MHPSRLTALVIVIAAAAAELVDLANATSYCEIRKTPDGFVALRAAPRMSGAVRARVRPGDEVLLGEERNGKWVRVTYWRGGRFASGNKAGDPPTGEGWVYWQLIKKDSCGNGAAIRGT